MLKSTLSVSVSLGEATEDGVNSHVKCFKHGKLLKSNDRFSFSIFPEMSHIPSARSLVLGRQSWV